MGSDAYRNRDTEALVLELLADYTVVLAVVAGALHGQTAVVAAAVGAEPAPLTGLAKSRSACR